MTSSYRTAGLYCEEHAAVRKRDLSRMYHARDRSGLPAGRPRKSVTAILRTCIQCGDYVKAGRTQFCSDACQRKHYRQNQHCKPGGYAICGPG